MRKSFGRVIVVGSLNVDYIASVLRLPEPGQTVSAHQWIRRFGGKGANQAMAAARQGAKVSMIGCVGADDEGRAYRKRLRAAGIDSRGVSTTKGALTGTALIAVDARAENTIIVASGANGELYPGAIPAFAGDGVLLLQQEIPMASVIEAVKKANRAGVPVIFNPSPLTAGFRWGVLKLDTVIVNSGEARSIFKMDVEKMAISAHNWRWILVKYNISRLIVTRGAKSTLFLDRSMFREVPTLRIKPVDTVGAGDAFAGTLAAGLAQGMEILEAIQRANCAGALTTLSAGAQEAVPTKAATTSALGILLRQKAPVAQGKSRKHEQV
jgi:ribokinase